MPAMRKVAHNVAGRKKAMKSAGIKLKFALLLLTYTSLFRRRVTTRGDGPADLQTASTRAPEAKSGPRLEDLSTSEFF